LRNFSYLNPEQLGKKFEKANTVVGLLLLVVQGQIREALLRKSPPE